MKDFRSLKVLDKFRFVFEKSGVNYKVMRKILQLKLIMDMRRVPTAMNNQNKDDDQDKNLFMKSLWGYGFVGLIIMFTMISPLSLFVKLNFCFGMMMFMIMTIMISDFSSVLLDIKDKNILLTKPIDPKTMNIAKVLHIFIYLFMITMSMAGPSFVAGVIKYGFLFGVLFFVNLIFIAGFIVFLSSLLYCFILHFFDGEKLKDIITYFQIILSITMTIGYQFIGRMFHIFKNDMVFTPKWWTYFIPTAWFSAPFELFINHNYAKHNIYLSILCILVPIVALIIHIKMVIPYFEKNLSKLNQYKAKNAKYYEIKGRIHKKIARIFCFEKMENIFFRFTQNMLSNERTLKLKIYPNIAFAAIFPLIIIGRDFFDGNSMATIKDEMAENKLYLFIYLTVQMMSSSVLMLNTSEKYKGVWIYKILPIKNYAHIYKGAWKGFLLKYHIPVLLFVSFIFSLFYGYKIIIDLILILLNMLLISILVFRNSSKELPFSKDFKHVQENSLGTFFFAAFICGVLAGIHFLVRNSSYGRMIYLGVVFILNVFLWKKSFQKQSINLT
ncbi:ABC transporter permease [Crassaminicella profunda]|uniref:ABC transporter permease n=1 Tax=Crassaminicella profunda TaxID=1286698 RepID=UPI001CA66C04|nr:ABC transporter permease [Crassaminicella profunda]QZY53908.1 ABC transporter permease [Crassaminicella profunda]